MLLTWKMQAEFYHMLSPVFQKFHTQCIEIIPCHPWVLLIWQKQCTLPESTGVILCKPGNSSNGSGWSPLHMNTWNMFGIASKWGYSLWKHMWRGNFLVCRRYHLYSHHKVAYNHIGCPLLVWNIHLHILFCMLLQEWLCFLLCFSLLANSLLVHLA